MSASSPQLQPDDTARWAPESCPFTVEYSRQVVEELRVYGEEWFQKIPHGGMEVGAVLFGTYQDGVVRILEWRPLPCEHAKGPGFTLSEKDLQHLERLAEEWAVAPELDGMVPVGWFHTHTRSGLFFSSDDCAIFDRYFPDPWALSLVLCYAKNKPVIGGFFYREFDGSVKGEESALAFTVEPNPALALRPKRRSAAPTRQHQRRASEPPPARPAPMRDPETVEQDAENGPPEPATPAPAPQWEPRRGTALSAPAIPDGEPARRSGLAWKVPLGLAAMLLFGAFGWLWFGSPAKPPASPLRLEPYEDQLLVLWDRNAPSVRDAERGVLTIRDGASERDVQLDMLMARRGSVTYARHSGDVQIGLKLYKGGAETFNELARFVGKAVDGETTPAAASISQTEMETKREELKRDLATERDRATKLREAKRRPRKTVKRKR
ncbi:MAG: hypothetical protein R2729_22610 [Bryobacteraceae bacterium]